MKSLRGISLLSCFAFVATLACGPGALEEHDLQTEKQSIIGGAYDPGDPAVVLVDLGDGYCTGTLIGPATVLTAAHCAPAQAVLFLDDAHGLRHVSYPLEQWVAENPDDLTHTSDVSVIRLSALGPPAWAKPVPLRSAPLTSTDLGTTIRHVGFGQSSPDDTSGALKRQASWPIGNVTPAFIYSGTPSAQTCHGDSGGPGLIIDPVSGEEQVAGVVSWGAPYCDDGAYDVRVDQQWFWIRSIMNRWEPGTCDEDLQCVPGCIPADVDCACEADGVCRIACRHPSTDPDCTHCAKDGVCSTTICAAGPDPDCLPDLAKCTADTACVSRKCTSDSQHGAYCAPKCGDGCPAGMTCLSDGYCQFDLLPERKLGETCRPGEDFCRPAGTICAGLEGEEPQCRFPCTSDRQCPSGEECMASPNVADHFCEAPPAPPPAPREPPAPAPDAGTSRPEPTVSQGCSSTGFGGGGWLVASILALVAPGAFRPRNLRPS